MKHLILLLFACAAVSANAQPLTRLASLSTCETCGFVFLPSTGKSVVIEDHSIKLGGATFSTNYYCRQHKPEFDRILVSSTGRNQHFKRQSEWMALDEMESPEMREWFRQLKSAESELKLLHAEEQRRIIYFTNTFYVTNEAKCQCPKWGMTPYYSDPMPLNYQQLIITNIAPYFTTNSGTLEVQVMTNVTLRGSMSVTNALRGLPWK